MPKILIRYDVDNWAFHRRALALYQHKRPGDQITLASNSAYSVGLADGFYDAVLLCDMTSLFPGHATEGKPPNRTKRLVRFVGSHGWMYDKYDPADWQTKGVNGRNARLARKIVTDCNTVTVHNRAQKAFFDAFHPDVRLMPYPVDIATFHPGPGKLFDRKLRVGWCGQLGGGEHSFKGFVEIMVPLIARSGDRFDWSINHRDYRTALKASELAKWYQSCDIFLCTSTVEGGPQTVYEAGACGCAVLSTEVGQVVDWAWLREQGATTPPAASQSDAGRVVDWFSAQLKHLDANRDQLDLLSQHTVRAVRDEFDARKIVPSHLKVIAGA